ncbi:MAG: radical SAM protein [Vicinamibacterales bacterium]
MRRAAWNASVAVAADRGIERMALPPRKIFLEVTAHCNIKCPMCPVTTGLERPRGTMAYELFEKVLDDIAGKVPELCLFLAGEPLLHKRIFDMIRAASDRGVYTTIHTNVMLLNDEKIARIFDSGLNELSFSFDGPTKERYDRVRVAGDYDKCIRLIRQVMQERRARKLTRPLTKIQIVYFDGEDPDDHRRQMREIFGADLPDEMTVVPAHSWAGEFQDFLRYRENVGDLDKLSICRMPWDRMAITWDGNVVGCCNDFLGKYHNGNVAKAPVLEVWNSPEYQKMRRLVHRKDYAALPPCKDCDVPWAGDQPLTFWKRTAGSALRVGLIGWRGLSGATLPTDRPAPAEALEDSPNESIG